MLQLANNVANCYFYAAKSPGNNKDACWQGFWKYKHYYMDGLEANHGKTCQRDLHYLLSLRRMLLAKFSSAEESLRCRKTFQALCQLHFGEPAYVEELGRLTDRVAPFPKEEAEAILKEAWPDRALEVGSSKRNRSQSTKDFYAFVALTFFA
eukprot:g30838.t1